MTDLDIQEIINSLSGSLGISAPTHTSNESTPTEVQSAVETLSETIDEIANNTTEETSNTEVVEEVEEEVQEEPNIIDPNPESENVSEITTRFSSAPWFNTIRNQEITIAGIGGIGSWATLLISRLSPSYIRIYDPDKVETVNMAGQLHPINNIGQTKVRSMTNQCFSYSDYPYVSSYSIAFDENTPCTRIMICGFDSMAARKTYFKAWSNYVENTVVNTEKKTCLFIDGRMSAEGLQIFCITGDDTYNKKRYADEFLFSDDEADSTVCSYKQTSFMAAIIGGIITNLLVNHINNITKGTIPRYLPFFTEYTGETMYLKTQL